MKKEEFEIIITNLDEIITRCEEIATKASSKALRTFPLKEVEIITNNARELQKKQDKILNTELYHIIGMGELSPAQEMVFLKLIKKLGATRSYIKSLANYIIPPIPEIPKKQIINVMY